MEVRRIRPGEGAPLRAIRLRALRESPEAFGSTYEREAEYPPKRWETNAARNAGGTQKAIFLAFDGGDPAGMAAAYTPDGRPDERHVWGMWVAPQARRHGIGRRLVDAVLGWAAESGALRVTLWVVDTNEAATALYGSAGFTPTGTQQRLPSHPRLVESLLELRLT